MKPNVYVIGTCDTMKKAFAWVDSYRIEYDFHGYKKDGVPPWKLKERAAYASL